ncbi:hypothetical protein [Rubritalea sp.]|uniref:hypothetical protein n=1 Tax=Rubritalea sp. TaxID=2109375 RepID=UPI003EF33584
MKHHTFLICIIIISTISFSCSKSGEPKSDKSTSEGFSEEQLYEMRRSATQVHACVVSGPNSDKFIELLQNNDVWCFNLGGDQRHTIVISEFDKDKFLKIISDQVTEEYHLELLLN